MKRFRPFIFAAALSLPVALAYNYCTPFVMYAIALVGAGWIGADLADWTNKP